jgi:Tfp pilus assembly protein PilF
MKKEKIPSMPRGVTLAEAFKIAVEAEQAGRLDQAESLLAGILAADPANPDALHVAAVVALRQHRFDAAIDSIEQAIGEIPDMAPFYRTLSEIQRQAGNTDAALTAAYRSLQLNPSDAPAAAILATIYRDRLELDAALECARNALAIAPDFAAAHFVLAEAYMLRGEFMAGWQALEWHTRHSRAGYGPGWPPLWDGRPLLGGTLLVIADSGIGDTIQFARFLPWAAECCSELVVACRASLHKLLDQVLPGVKLVEDGQKMPPVSTYCTLSGLALRYGATRSTIPREIPYLRADPELQATWAARLAPRIPPEHRRVGIVWAGRPEHENDFNRSASLAALAPIGEAPLVTLISLQTGAAASQIGRYAGAAPLIGVGHVLASLEDTMAVIAGLDVLITVDTAVAHLAGAMGKTVWIMLPYVPDWRWMLGTTESPWYPTAKLFRQPARGRWDLVVHDVVAELGGR